MITLASQGSPRYKKLLGPGLKGDFSPRMIKPSKINYDLYVRHFPGFSLNAIKKTFMATTQYARRGAFPGFHMKHMIKSPNPTLHIPRRHEAVATDTAHGPKGVPAVDNGSTTAQIFVGRTSGHVWVKGCGKSDKTFVKVLYDCIRKFGAMDLLISDCAKAQISNKVQDLLRELFIDDRQILEKRVDSCMLNWGQLSLINPHFGNFVAPLNCFQFNCTRYILQRSLFNLLNRVITLRPFRLLITGAQASI